MDIYTFIGNLFDKIFGTPKQLQKKIPLIKPSKTKKIYKKNIKETIIVKQKPGPKPNYDEPSDFEVRNRIVYKTGGGREIPLRGVMVDIECQEFYKVKLLNVAKFHFIIPKILIGKKAKLIYSKQGYKTRTFNKKFDRDVWFQVRMFKEK